VTSAVKARQFWENGLTPVGHEDVEKYAGSFCMVTTSGTCTWMTGCGTEEFGDGMKAELMFNPSAPGL